MKTKSLFLFVITLFINQLNAQSFLSNGDFQSGGIGVGFNIYGVGYNQINAPYTGTVPGDYAFVTNTQLLNNPVFLNFTDHTGSGNMLVIDGNTTGGQQRFWEAGNYGNGVSGLTVGTTYKFSYWIRSASSTVTNIATRADIGIQIDNSSTPVLVSAAGSNIAPLPGTWQQVIYSFVPTNSTVYIKLYNNNLSAVGNDFAVDDFKLSGPLGATYSAQNPDCVGANNGAIVVYATGGTTPYATYNLTGTATASNSTGIFPNLAPGTYAVSVTDSAPSTFTINNIIISNPVNPLVVSPDVQICGGTSTTLSVSGGTTYTWTASPADSSLTSPNSTTPTVTPNNTTVYTVSSPVTSTTNLVTNGDFSQGNSGFSSDYIYTISNTSGSQRYYGVVANPSSWFASLSNCPDNTTGTGNMIVFDGSNINGGNDKVWGQTIAVSPGQTYTFSFWVQSLYNTFPASLETLINGISIGVASAPSVSTCGNWTQFSYTWNSGVNTTAQIALYDRITSADGNDFALDDITFTKSTTCTYTKTVTVTNKRATIFDRSITLCLGGTFNATPLNVLPNVIPAGTTYTWSAPIISPANALSGGSAQSNPQTTISQTLTNNTLGAATATYTVYANSGTAASPCIRTFYVIVTVRPSALISNKTQTICSGSAFTVTPVNSGTEVVPSGTTYTWSAPVIAPAGSITGGSAQTYASNNISQTLTNTTASLATATYTITASTGTSPNICTNTFTITVSVNPKPAIANKTLSICKTGTINYTPQNTLPDIVPTGTTYTWTAPVIAPTATAITGGTAQTSPQTSITQNLTNTTAANATATYIVTASSGSGADACTSTFTLVVTVTQGITISNKTASICKTGTFTIVPINSGTDVVPDDTTYTWPTPTISPAGAITGGTAQTTGTTSVSQSLTNISLPAANATATYTVTASSGIAPNICTTTFTVTVAVNPTINIANKTASICTGSSFSVIPINSATETVPVGTTYTWTNPTVSPANSITGGSAQTTPQNSISQILTNTTAANATATYTVTASVGTAPNICTRTFTITVTVRPSAIIADKFAVICTGSAFSVTPTNTPPDVLPTGTTFTWSAPVISPTGAITGGAAQAIAQTSIGQTLTNNTASLATATYTVTANSGIAPNNCTSTFKVIVTVNPMPIIANKTATSCSGPFTLTPVNGVGGDVVPSGTLYTWPAPVISPAGSINGSNAQPTGINSIVQTLTNTSSGVATATYTVTAKSGNAPNKCSTTFTIVVTINPRASITNKTASICLSGPFTVTPVNSSTDFVPAGTTYTWAAPVISPAGAISGGSAVTTPQTSIGQTLTNVSSPGVNATATYTVVATSGSAPNICTNTFTIVVSVNQNIQIANKTASLCKSGSFTLTPSNTSPDIVPDGTTYTWSLPVINPTGAITGGTAQTTGVASITQTLTNITNAPAVDATATYTVTATSGTCTTTFTLTVSVNQVLAISNKTASICSGSAFTIAPSTTGTDFVSSGTTYSWTAPVIAPASTAITGGSAQAGQTNISQTLTNTTTANATATYTVTATNGTCSVTFTTTITVLPSPSVVMSGNQMICPGNTATLTFLGTPTSSVKIVDSNGTFYLINLNAAGVGTFTSPILNATTTYSLVSIRKLTNTCFTNYSGITSIISVVPNGCATVVPGNTESNNLTTCEAGKCFSLSFDYSPIASTTSYAVSAIPYCPQSAFINTTAPWLQLYPGPPVNPGGVNGDDQWSAPFAFPGADPSTNPPTPQFQFCFFGNNYNTCQVGTNGLITFKPHAQGPTCRWQFNQTIPNATFNNVVNLDDDVSNAIYGVYQDTNYAVPVPLPDVLSANYAVVGTYPCRKFIANFANLPQFQCGTSVGLQTSQIVLYEVSNIIEVYVQKRTPCTSWNSGGSGVIGIQNETATVAYAPPGRNTGAWTATNEAWRFTPTGAPVPVSFQWQEGTASTSPIISNTTDVTVCPTVTTTYKATAKYEVCGIVQKSEKLVTITVNQDPTQAPNDLLNCGTNTIFNLNSELPIVLGNLNASNFQILFYRSQSDANLQTNAITSPNAYSGTNGEIIYMGIKDLVTNCYRIKPFTLLLSIPPTVTVPTNFSVCAGTVVAATTLVSNPVGATYQWTCDNTNIGLAASGNGDVPSFTATNTSLVPISATITITPTYNGCIGTPSSYVITVNPILNTAITCGTATVNTIAFNWSFVTGATSYSVSYQINSNPIVVVGDIGNLITYTVPGISPNDSVKLFVTPVGAIGTCFSQSNVTCVANSCEQITNPSANQSLCLNSDPTALTVTTSLTAANSVSFVYFSSQQSSPNMYSGGTLLADVTPSGGIATYDPPTLGPGSIPNSPGIYYVYAIQKPTPTGNVCRPFQEIIITVYNNPSVANETTSICSDGTFTVTPSSASPNVIPTGTLYTWTVTPPVGITGASNQTTGQASISQTLTNTTNAAINVVYTVMATAGVTPNTCSTSFTITVTVNPKPSIANEVATICSGGTFTVTPSSASPNSIPTGTLYTWTVTPPVGINGASNQTTGQASISQTLTNTTNAAINVVYTVMATAGTCTNTFTVTITVNPKPSIANEVTTICSGGTFTVTPSSASPNVIPIGTLYTWTVTPPVGISGASNQTTGQTSISQTLTNTTNAAINIVYTVTATAGTCTNTFTVTVTVNPKPNIANEVATICSGGTFTVTPSSASPNVIPIGTLYTWTVIPPVGINGASNQTTGQANISQTLTNTNNAAINVVYTVTATAGTCTNTFTVTVTVNPKPSIAIEVATICTGGTFTVTPSSASPNIIPTGTLYTWTVTPPLGINGASNQTTGQTSISQTLTNTTNAAINVVYTVTATAGTCTNTFTVTVTVNPKPSIANEVATICSDGTFTVTPSSASSNIIPTGTLYTWTVTPPVGINGASNQTTGQTSISQTLTNTTNAPITVVYNVIASVGSATCTNTFTVTVTVNPKPSIANEVATICSGGTFTVTPSSASPNSIPTGTLYTWTVTPPVGINGTSNQTSGQASISQTLTNTTNAAINVVYTVTATAGTCTNTFTVTVTVNPKPSIANEVATICSDGTFTVTPSSASPNSIPTGTLYTWTVTPPVGITGASNQTTGQASISQTLTNTTNAAINVVYTVTATAGTCTNTFTVTVTVNPKPSIANEVATICSGGTFTVTPSSASPNSIPTGTLYTWFVTPPIGITGASNQTTGQTSISQTLTNTTNAAINVVYTVTATAGTCTNTFTVTVTVNPKPSIANEVATICTGGTFTVTPSSASPNSIPTGTLYTWTVTPPVGIIGASNQTTEQASISQTLTNTTNAAINVVYTVTATAGTCTNTFTVTVTVNPKPTVTVPANSSYCDGDIVPDITFVSNPVGGTFTWTSTQNIGLPLSGTGNIAAFTATNTGLAPLTTTITVTPTINGCIGTASTFTITVNSKPIINTPTPYQVCDEDNNRLSCLFDLHTKDAEIKTNSNQIVTYYLTHQDAENNQNIQSQNPFCTSAFDQQTLHVRVVDPSAPNCASYTTLQLIVNPKPTPKPVISDFVQCDFTNPGDGIELFDLTTKDSEIKNGQSGVNIIYFDTQNNAIAGLPTIPNPAVYPSTTKLVWFRIVNSTTGCYAIGSFNLIVRPLPNVVNPNPMYACSTTNQADFMLSTNDTVVTVGNTSLLVTYHNSLLNAQNNVQPSLNATSYLGTDNEIVYIRVEDNSPQHCYSIATVVLHTSQGPTIAPTSSLSLCDDDNNGQAVFTLSDAYTQIFGTPTVPSGVALNFYLTAADANLNIVTSALPNTYPNAQVVGGVQVIYYTAVYTATGCKTVGELTLHINPTPVATTPADYHLCDDNTDGQTVFNLPSRTNEILGTIDPTITTVSYYTSLPFAQLGGTAGLITNPSLSNYLSPTRTIWVRVTTTATGCFDIVELHLVVDPLPTVLASYVPFETCETVAPIGKEFFDLTTKTSYILQGQPNMEVIFYPSYLEAVNDQNAIGTPQNYENTTVNSQTIGFRIRNTLTGCYVVSSMTLIVNPKPTLVAPTSIYTVCEPGNFNLCSLSPGILNGSTYALSYHASQAEAESNSNPLACNYTNSNAIQFVYARAEDPIKHCVTIMQIELHVNPQPKLPTNLTDITLCDEDTNPQDGCTRFNLDAQTPVILAAQPTAASNYSVNYYTTQAAASSNPAGGTIVSSSSYPACGTKTIWYRVQDIATGCYTFGSFQIQVVTPVVLTTPTLLNVCDYDANPNDQHTAFNMSGFIGLPAGISSVDFYEDAAHTIHIDHPENFTNTTPGPVQTVYIVATNTTGGCKSFRTLTIQVLPVPTPKTDPPALPDQCENATGSGVQTLNLTLNANYIINLNPNVALHYYRTQQDAENATNEISLPNAALVGNPTLVGQVQYVYIAVVSTVYFGTDTKPCRVVVAQPFKINPLPKLTTIPVYSLCDDDTDGQTHFDLTSQANALLALNPAPLSNYSLSFYTSLVNVQNNVAIGSPGNYLSVTTVTNPTQIIYVVATNTTTGCKSDVGQFTIQVNPIPTATAPINYFTCDDDGTNDGFYPFPLDDLIPGILGPLQSPINFTTTFYDSLADANGGTNAITSLHTYQTYTHTIWIRVENNTTHCYRIVSFTTTIEKNPEPFIISSTGSNVICVDYKTGVVVRSLTLMAQNANPGLCTYQWYLNGQLLTGETNATLPITTSSSVPRFYNVLMTSATNCAGVSNQFEVIQSSQAVITGPTGYAITNAFTENQTIVVTVVGYGDYLYSLDDGPRQVSNIFENVPFEPNPHKITVWDNSGGIYESCDPLIIENIRVIDYPHYFTPNGDGINDTWNIVGLEDQPAAKIYIFDRFGKLIKQISPQGDGWDGTFNSELLPSTDYWFTVDYNEEGAIKQFKAHFALKR